MQHFFRPLSDGDAAAVQELLEASPEYTRRITGGPVGPQDGADVLGSQPPPRADGVSVLSWKRGMFSSDGRHLLGLCTVVPHWPEQGTAHIGLLLIRTDQTGQGLGRALHEAVVAELAEDSALHTLRLGIVSTNHEAAAPFWRALGYSPTGQTKPFDAGPEGPVGAVTAIWTRPLRA